MSTFKLEIVGVGDVEQDARDLVAWIRRAGMLTAYDTAYLDPVDDADAGLRMFRAIPEADRPPLSQAPYFQDANGHWYRRVLCHATLTRYPGQVIAEQVAL